MAAEAAAAAAGDRRLIEDDDDELVEEAFEELFGLVEDLASTRLFCCFGLGLKFFFFGGMGTAGAAAEEPLRPEEEW